MVKMDIKNGSDVGKNSQREGDMKSELGHCRSDPQSHHCSLNKFGDRRPVLAGLTFQLNVNPTNIFRTFLLPLLDP